MARLFKATFLLLSLALLCFALYPKAFFLKFCAWKINHQMKGACTWDSLDWKNGELVLENCLLNNLPHYQMKMKEIHVDLFSKKLKIVGVDFISFKKNEDFPFREVTKLFEKNPYKATIEKGRLLLYDHSLDGKSVFQKGDFSFQEGALQIALEGAKEVKILFGKEGFECSLKEATIPSLFPFFYFFCDSFFPKEYRSWNFSSGQLSGQFFFSYPEHKVKGRIEIDHLRGKDEKHHLLCRLDHLKSTFDFDLKTGEKFDCEFTLKEGCLSLMGGHPEFWEGLWDFHLFGADIVIKDGQVESSKIAVNLLGMEGEIALKYLPEDPLLRLKFIGSSQKMVSLLPGEMQKKFSTAFPDDTFELHTNVRKTPLGLDLEGDLAIQAKDSEKNILYFGCHFGKKEENDPSHASHKIFKNLKEQFYLSEKRVGWFKGDHFPLRKFLTPFLFGEKELHISGACDFEGSFDERYLAIYYKGKDFSLDGPHFSLSCDTVQEGISKDIVACHYIDLKTFDHVGILPVKKAKYLQKNLGIHFEDAEFSAFFENNKIDVRSIKTSSESIDFHGDVKLELAKNSCDLKITTREVRGGLPSALHFLSHLFPGSVWNLPLNGEISSGHGGLFLHFQFDPKAHLLDAYILGKVKAGYETEALTLNDYRFVVEYDKHANRLEFREGEGSINFKNAAPYTLSLPILSFSNFPSPEVKAEVYVNSPEKEIFRLIGNYTKKNFFINGKSFAVYGSHDKGSLVVESFNIGKMSGKGVIDWNTPNIAIKLDEIKTKENENILSFECLLEKKGFPTLKNEGLYLQAANLSFAGVPDPFRLGTLHFDFEKQTLNLEDYAFSVTQNDFFIIKGLVDSFFPHVPESVFEVVSQLKEGDPIEGKISIQYFPGSTLLQVTLKDGVYCFKNQSHQVRNFSFNFDPNFAKAKGDLFYNDQFFTVEVNARRMSGFQDGVMTLREEGKPEPCLLYWKKNEGKLEIERAQGKLFGLEVFLRKQNDGTLSGQVAIDLGRALYLLPQEERAKFLPLNLQGTCHLDGDFQIPFSHPNGSRFSGVVHAENFSVGGVQLDHLSSIVSCSNDKIALKHLQVEDWGGKAEIECAAFMKEEGRWKFSVPQVKLENVRLSRLKSDLVRRNKKGFSKPYFFPSFTLDHFEGVIGDPLSLKGSGILRFTNISPKNFFTNLLYLPKEITARIGLDLNLLVPARGEIHYEIKEGKIHLSEFKGMYSEGKRSRFYLAEGYPATVDFDGNLNLKVKMKQYNLLMKVAELFVVTVKGDIFKPVYTLSQEREPCEDEST